MKAGRLPWEDKPSKRLVRQHASAPIAVASPSREGSAAGRRYAPQWLRERVLVRDKYRCVYCGASVTNATANIDHKVPWPDGLTVLPNLLTACGPCNQAKGRDHAFSRRRAIQHKEEQEWQAQNGPVTVRRE